MGWMRISDFLKMHKNLDVELRPDRGEIIVRFPNGDVAYRVLADFTAGIIYGWR